MAKYYLGIDVGTFETKGVLVNEAYEVVAAHSAKHEMENPQPNHFEQDAEAVWWNDFCKVSKGILQETRIDPRDIAGVGADVLGATAFRWMKTAGRCARPFCTALTRGPAKKSLF